MASFRAWLTSSFRARASRSSSRVFSTFSLTISATRSRSSLSAFSTYSAYSFLSRVGATISSLATSFLPEETREITRFAVSRQTSRISERNCFFAGSFSLFIAYVRVSKPPKLSTTFRVYSARVRSFSSLMSRRLNGRASMKASLTIAAKVVLRSL